MHRRAGGAGRGRGAVRSARALQRGLHQGAQQVGGPWGGDSGEPWYLQVKYKTFTMHLHFFTVLDMQSLVLYIVQSSYSVTVSGPT